MVLIVWTAIWVTVGILVYRWLRGSVFFVDDVRNLTHELPYWTIRDGVVILRDGSYQYGVETYFPATEVADISELDRIVRGLQRLLNNAVPEGETLRVMVEVSAAAEGVVERFKEINRSTDRIVRALHEARAAEWKAHCSSGRIVSYRVFFLCSYHPRRVAVRKVPFFAPISEKLFRTHLEEIAVRRDMLLVHCQSIGINAVPLDDRALMVLIWRYWNPETRYHIAPPEPPIENQRMEYPRKVLVQIPGLALPSVRSRAATGGVLVRRDHLWLDGRYVQIVTMDRLPSGATVPGMFGNLLTSIREGWVVIDCQHLERGPELKRLELKARTVWASRFGFGREDPRSSVQSTEVEEALRRAYSTDSRIFLAGVRVVVYESDEQAAYRTAMDVARAFQGVPGVAPVRETVALWPSYLACSPASGIPIHRRSRVFTDNAADFLPLTGPWNGSERPVMLFGHRSDAIVPFDPMDPRFPAWNQLVVGSTGSGKTHLANLLVLNLMATQPLVTIVDRGGGYRTLVNLVGGHTVWLGPGTDVAINPMDVSPGQLVVDEDGKVHVDEVKVAFLVALVGMMVTRGGQAYTDREQLIVSEAARQTYQRLYEEYRMGRPILLRDLRNSLLVYQPRVDTPELGIEARKAANDLAVRMSDWVEDGVYASLFDRPTSVDLYGDAVLYFDTEGLAQDSPVLGVAMAIIADVAWRRARREDSPGSLVVLDEAWVYLRIPVAAQFVEEMFRRFRRYRAMALVITQEPDDLLSGAIGSVILNNSQVWYLLRGTYRPEVLDLMRLNERCQAIVGQLAHVRGQYSEMLLLADTGAGKIGDVVVVRPGSLDYWIATSDRSDRLLRDEMVKACGGDLWNAICRLALEYPRGLGAAKVIGLHPGLEKITQGGQGR